MADQPGKMRIVCAACGAQYLIGPDKVGQKVQCLKCRALFVIAGPGATPAPAPPVSDWQAAIAARTADQSRPVAVPGPKAPAMAQTVPPSRPVSPQPGPAAGPAQPAPRAPAQNLSDIAARVSIKSRCPHCDFQVTLPRTFIGGELSCPQCRKRFTVFEEGAAPWEPEPPFWRKLLEDRRAVYTAAAVIGILLVAGILTLVMNVRAESKFKAYLSGIYYAPNYTFKKITPPRSDRRVVHKSSDGSVRCSEAVYVHIAHGPSGMEFDRVFCRLGSRWEPTYRQTIADRVALEALTSADGEWSRQDVGNIAWTVYSPEAGNLGELYNTALPEEKEVALKSGSAFDQLTHGNDWATLSRRYDDEEDYPDFADLYYLAHAVMYPDQAAGLYEEGKIAELP